MAGPVTLLESNTWVGIGQLGVIPPGAPFHLSFGSYDGIDVKYEFQKEIEEEGDIGIAEKHLFTATSILTNTTPSQLQFNVLGRIPLSENRGVRVMFLPDQASDGYMGPDRNGHVRWNVTLPPGKTQSLSWAFRLIIDEDVQLLGL